jgi:hypothetical protein
MFKLAVDDRILLENPVAGVKEERVAKPIRLTPSFEEFMSIVVRFVIRNFPIQGRSRQTLSSFMV